MSDPLTSAERSAHMAKIRGEGNLSTELKVEFALKKAGFDGWIKHPKEIRGKPDFYFPKQRLALFVDGCFWHGCQKCNRNIPKTQSDFWQNKINENRRRDNRTRRHLWRHGYHVMRIWEHDLKKEAWLKRLEILLNRLNSEFAEPLG